MHTPDSLALALRLKVGLGAYMSSTTMSLMPLSGGRSILGLHVVMRSVPVSYTHLTLPTICSV
eukprot:5463326-Alexandrium_andersonii.AAC.1